MSRARVAGIALLALLAGAAAWVALGRLPDPGRAASKATPDVASAPREAAPPPAEAAGPQGAGIERAARPPGTAPDASDGMDADGGLERAVRWSVVDLEAIRDEIPENLYWEMGAPTDDPAVQEERARQRARWNEAWGRVQAGIASEEEIHAWFAHRQRLSTDYIEFASLLLDRHRDVLPERDVGLLELAVRMHHTRLQELPRRLSEALERKQRQDALREAWLRDEARFAAPGPDAP